MRRGGTVAAGAVVLSLAATALAQAQPSITFAPVQNFATGSLVGPGPGATTTIAGDVDGDGDADVVITDPITGSGPIVMRNVGDGTFGAPTTAAGVSGLGALAAGDMNGDGRLDVVGRGGGQVVVLLGNGDGSFRVGDQLSLPSNAQQAVAVVDANADGHLDVVTPTPVGIQALLGRGDGTVTTGPVTPLLGLLPDLAPADFDGDGTPDLAVVDATPFRSRIVALRGNGDGSFALTGAGAVRHGPEAVSVGDLDGDGDDDVVSVDSFSAFATLGSFTITVLLSDGHGRFGAPAYYPVANGPVSGAIADVDGDGDLDVVVSGVGAAAVSIYAGDGTGRLCPLGSVAVTGFPQTPAVADFDRDGRPDIAVPGPGRLSILRNATSP